MYTYVHVNVCYTYDLTTCVHSNMCCLKYVHMYAYVHVNVCHTYDLTTCVHSHTCCLTNVHMRVMCAHRAIQHCDAESVA